MAVDIIADRETNGPFESKLDPNTGEYSVWLDMLRCKGIGPKKLEVIRKFADSDDPFGLQRTARAIAKVRAAMEGGELNVPWRTHTSDEIDPNASIPRVIWWGQVRLKEYKDLIEDERSKTGDDVEEIMKRVKRPKLAKSCTLHCYDEGDEDVYLKFNRFVFPKFAKQLAAITTDRDIVIAIGSAKPGFGVGLRPTRIFIVDPED
jgi:hypothetical protein